MHIPPLVGRIEPELIGDCEPSVWPGDDPRLLGQARIDGTGPFEVRSYQSFSITYTVGRLGLDDTGGIRIACRAISDAGRPHFTDASAPNYVSVSSTGEGRLELSYERMGGQRPWSEILTIMQVGGCLREGDEITIRYGDRSGGSAGMLMQTFAESNRVFRVMADVQATGNFMPLPDSYLAMEIVPGPPVLWRAVLPSLRRPGEDFTLGIKAEDAWGNPTATSALLGLRASASVDGLPAQVTLDGAARGVTIEPLSCAQEDTLWIDILSGDDVLARAGPLVIRAGDHAGYWADLHGQSGETIGVTSLAEYMDFARNLAFLDVTSHQGNDFQLTNAFWDHLNQTSADLDEPGRFSVFPGYEWSGNTAVGGDHNVFFRHEGEQIRRCSHAILADRSDAGNDAFTLSDLYAGLHADKADVVMFAHVGGRYADISYDFDAALETAVEIHSDWGTFEWIAKDSFDLGRRVGIVANSDGHKGRPGASYPGVSEFGAYGGLTCYLAPGNTRDDLFEAMRRRHHYATTGCRMAMDLRADLPGGATLYTRSGDTDGEQVSEAMMGDILRSDAQTVDIRVDLACHAGIERVELRRGSEVIEVIRPWSAEDLGNRVQMIWTGAEYRGRGRQTHWRGRLDLDRGAIRNFRKINAWNPEARFEQRGARQLVWHTVTTGNFMGADLTFDTAQTDLALTSNHGALSVRLEDLGMESIEVDCGGLDRRLRCTRLPKAPLDRALRFTRSVALHRDRDTPIWICVTTEDGYQAWSSPIYLIR